MRLERTDDVIRWAADRGILTGSTPLDQAKKTMEEAQELFDATSHAEAIDAIGDILVTLIIGAEMRCTDLDECLEHAWQQIKDRKGLLLHGCFLKQRDLDSLLDEGFMVRDGSLQKMCKHPEQRDSAISVLNSYGFQVASCFYADQRMWRVYSAGFGKQESM